MAPAPRTRRRMRGVRNANASTIWKIAAVVAFILVDVLLITLAVNANRADPSATASSGFDEGTFIGGGTAQPPESEAPAPAAVAAAPRYLSVAGPGVAWRASDGGCPDGEAAVEATIDGGATWQPFAVGSDARRVLGLQAQSADQVRVVGAVGEGCVATYFETFSGGQFFEQYPERLATVAYRDAIDPALVHTPSGDALAPCPVLQVAPRDTATGVLCTDLVAELPVGAAEWDQLAVPGVLSAAPTATGYAIAVAGVEGCAGIAVESLTVPLAESVRSPVSCLEDPAPSGVTLAASENELWLWTGDSVRVSTDGGITWP